MRSSVLGHDGEVEEIERGVVGALASCPQTRHERRVTCIERIETMSREVVRHEGGSGSKGDHLREKSFGVDALCGLGEALPTDWEWRDRSSLQNGREITHVCLGSRMGTERMWNRLDTPLPTPQRNNLGLLLEKKQPRRNTRKKTIRNKTNEKLTVL